MWRSWFGTSKAKRTKPRPPFARLGVEELESRLAPVSITSISPASGGVGGGSLVTIAGAGFTGASAVSFGPNPAAGFFVSSDAQIQAVSPQGTGSVDITVTTSSGVSAASANDLFAYLPPPIISSVSPGSGTVAGGTSVTITGANFTGATHVDFGPYAADFVVSSDTQIVATTPVARAGLVDVRITSANGISAVSGVDQFTFTQGAVAAPVVGSISPNVGPGSGGTQVIITGTNLAAPAWVKFGTLSATIVSSSASQIVVTTPASVASELLAVTVATGGGISAVTLADQFRYAATPTAAVFKTGPQALMTGVPSGNILIQLQDSTGGLAYAGPGGITFLLATTSAGGAFLNATGSPLGSPTILIPQGASSVSFAYKDANAGSPMLTLTSTLPALTQQQTVAGAALHVTNTNDAGAGSLRQAITTANATPNSSIVFDPGVTGTINLLSQFQDLAVNLNVIGPGANLLTIQRSASAAGSFGIFNVLAGVAVTLTDLTASNANSTGIVNNGSLTLKRIAVLANQGGILNLGTLAVLSSTVAINAVSNGSAAAGIDSEAGAVVIIDSTISDNTTDHTNSAAGVGVYGGTLYIANSTVARNVVNDSNSSGGGIDAHGVSSTIVNTLVAGNTGGALNPSDVAGVFSSLGHNLIGSAESHSAGFGAAGDQIGTLAIPIDARLDSVLQNNGGPTPTHALFAGSPAIDAGDSTSAPAADQRGFTRIVSTAIDIGAYEFVGPFSVALSSVAMANASVPVGASTSVTLTARDGGGNQLHTGGLTVAFALGAGPANGTFSSVVDNGNGSYTATFTAGVLPGGNTISATINGQAVTSTAPAFTISNGPVGTTASDLPTFRWASVAGAVRYDIWVVDVNSGQSPVLRNPNATGNAWTASQALTPGHAYTWYLGAVNSGGQTSYSAGQNFTIAPLAAPVQTSPITTIAPAAGYDTPTFAWNPVPGANHYYLLVIDASTGQAVINNPNVFATSYSGPTLTPGHSFTWYVGAISNNGAVNSFLATGRTFALTSLPAPAQTGPPALAAVSNGYDTPTLTWNPVAGAHHYFVYAVDSSLGQVVINNPGVFGTAYLAPALTPGHSFTWYVGAISTNGLVNSFLASGQTFTLAALPAPVQTGPANATTILAANGYDMPIFRWNPVTGAHHYFVYAIDANIGQVVINNPTVLDTSFSAPALTPGHTFTWYVGAISTNGLVNSYGASGQTFTLAPLAAPSQTALGTTANATPTFAWSAVDGADHYYLYLIDISVGTVLIDNPKYIGISFTPGMPLARGHRYTWYIAAVSTNSRYMNYLTAGDTFAIT